jgi:hypothetical protein
MKKNLGMLKLVAASALLSFCLGNASAQSQPGSANGQGQNNSQITGSSGSQSSSGTAQPGRDQAKRADRKEDRKERAEKLEERRDQAHERREERREERKEDRRHDRGGPSNTNAQGTGTSGSQAGGRDQRHENHRR